MPESLDLVRTYMRRMSTAVGFGMTTLPYPFFFLSTLIFSRCFAGVLLVLSSRSFVSCRGLTLTLAVVTVTVCGAFGHGDGDGLWCLFSGNGAAMGGEAQHLSLHLPGDMPPQGGPMERGHRFDGQDGGMLDVCALAG